MLWYFGTFAVADRHSLPGLPRVVNLACSAPHTVPTLWACRVTPCSTRRATGRYRWTRGLRASASMLACKGKEHSLRKRQVCTCKAAVVRSGEQKQRHSALWSSFCSLIVGTWHGPASAERRAAADVLLSPLPGGRMLPPMGFYRFRLPPASRLPGEGESDSRDFGVVGSASEKESEHNHRSSLQSRCEPQTVAAAEPKAGDPFQRPTRLKSELRELIQTPLDPTGGASPLGFPSGHCFSPPGALVICSNHSTFQTSSSAHHIRLQMYVRVRSSNVRSCRAWSVAQENLDDEAKKGAGAP